MTADSALPVWTIKPNWRNNVIERLSWLTDVLASTFGTEQRRALRLSPRREFEMVFNPVDNVRSYFDLWLHRMGSYEFMVPLFHDQGKLSASILSNATFIPFDTTYREFRAGDLAILIGDDPFTYDKVTVNSIGGGSITALAGEVTRAWPKGTRIYPLRRARISDESLLAALTNRVGEATLQFQLNQENDLGDEGAWDTLYGDYPIILDPPNRRENLDLSFNRNSLLLDNDLGLRVLADDAGRAFTTQVDSRMMKGRAEHWAFRQMLYRLRGQQGTVWLPTFNRDVELSRAANAADHFLKIKNIGYAYTGGGAEDGRTHILLPDGSVVAVLGVGAPPSASEEYLTLTGAVGANWPAGTFGSFVDTCRLVSDDIEITHYTDTDGAAECNLGFRSFRDPRTAPDPLDAPIPAADISQDSCGDPAPEEAACVPTYESGFYGVLRFTYSGTLPNPGTRGGMNISIYRGADRVAYISSFGTYPGTGTGTWSNSTDGLAWPDGSLTGEVGYVDDSAILLAPGDPFAAGLPDRIHVQQQYPYGAFNGGGSGNGGEGTVSLTFHLPNGPTYQMLAGGSETATMIGLWPVDTDWTFS